MQESFTKLLASFNKITSIVTKYLDQQSSMYCETLQGIDEEIRIQRVKHVYVYSSGGYTSKNTAIMLLKSAMEFTLERTKSINICVTKGREIRLKILWREISHVLTGCFCIHSLGKHTLPYVRTLTIQYLSLMRLRIHSQPT